MKKRWMLAMLGTVLWAAPLCADDTTAKTMPETPKMTEPAKPMENKGQEKQVAKLAAKFNVSEADIRAMRSDGKGMGWGEIGHALAIAQKSGQPLADILKLRESKMGWGEIAKKYNLKLGEITGKAKDIEKEGKKAEKADERTVAKAKKADEKAAAKAKKADEKAAAKSERAAEKAAGSSDKGSAGRAHGAGHGNSGGAGGGHGGGPKK